MNKKIVYVDMDGVLCDYWKRFHELESELIRLPQTTFGFYTSLEPIEGAIEAYKQLEEKYDVWILTRPSYQNPMCYTEKRVWVEKYLGLKAAQKLIICWNKGLLKGDYLIDDTLIPTPKTQEEYYMQTPFGGKFIHYGSSRYKNWNLVKEELL
jgi:5'(3')-deoxyribonucleotidase